MQTLEIQQDLESKETPRDLKEKSLEFFRTLGGKTLESIRDDSDFKNPDEVENFLLYGPIKLILSGAIPTVAIEASNTVIDEIYSDEQLKAMAKLGPLYIMSFIKSGARNINEFIEKVI
jgi:hypothetical protein